MRFIRKYFIDILCIVCLVELTCASVILFRFLYSEDRLNFDSLISTVNMICAFLFGLSAFYQNILARRRTEESIELAKENSQQTESLAREVVDLIAPISTGMESVNSKLERMLSENSKSDASDQDDKAFNAEKLTHAIEDLAR